MASRCCGVAIGVGRGGVHRGRRRWGGIGRQGGVVAVRGGSDGVPIGLGRGRVESCGCGKWLRKGILWSWAWERNFHRVGNFYWHFYMLLTDILNLCVTFFFVQLLLHQLEVCVALLFTSWDALFFRNIIVDHTTRLVNQGFAPLHNFCLVPCDGDGSALNLCRLLTLLPGPGLKARGLALLQVGGSTGCSWESHLLRSSLATNLWFFIIKNILIKIIVFLIIIIFCFLAAVSGALKLSLSKFFIISNGEKL